MNNKTFWTPKPELDAPAYLGGVRAQHHMRDLTQYLRMLRAGYPGTRLVAVHTMPQRSARLQTGHMRSNLTVKADYIAPCTTECDEPEALGNASIYCDPDCEHCDGHTSVRRTVVSNIVSVSGTAPRPGQNCCC